MDGLDPHPKDVDMASRQEPGAGTRQAQTRNGLRQDGGAAISDAMDGDGRRDLRERRLRAPRLAEMVASFLRDDILSGRLDEGDELPRQEDLLKEFRVSPPAIREALRILETEGLVTVRRGNVGGAIVHVPKATGVAYMVGLVLQRQRTTLHDVGVALAQLEPLCAAMCAERPDRMKTVVPELERHLEEQESLTSDGLEWIEASRRFHVAIVSGIQNDTMNLLIGALESIWTSQEDRIFDLSAGPLERDGKLSIKAHKNLIKAIKDGDAERALDMSRRHLSAAGAYTGERNPKQTVIADSIRHGPGIRT